MAILTYSARTLLARYLLTHPLYLAIGRGKTSWDTDPEAPDYEDTDLLSIIGYKKLTRSFFVNEDDIKELMQGFEVKKLRHIDDIRTATWNGGGMHYFIEADAVKDDIKPDYSGIIGKTVSGRIDRPLGSTHPRIPGMTYTVNYGYVEGVFAEDGAEQDIYLLGADKPAETFTGKVIAVWHRYNDVEDKWIVSADGRDYADDEISEKIEFQEKYFDGELFR